MKLLVNGVRMLVFKGNGSFIEVGEIAAGGGIELIFFIIIFMRNTIFTYSSLNFLNSRIRLLSFYSSFLTRIIQRSLTSSTHSTANAPRPSPSPPHH